MGRYSITRLNMVENPMESDHDALFLIDEESLGCISIRFFWEFSRFGKSKGQWYRVVVFGLWVNEYTCISPGFSQPCHLWPRVSCIIVELTFPLDSLASLLLYPQVLREPLHPSSCPSAICHSHDMSPSPATLKTPINHSLFGSGCLFFSILSAQLALASSIKSANLLKMLEKNLTELKKFEFSIEN